MSDMQIEIVANPINTVPTAKGSYQVIELAYKNKSFQDKLEGKKVMSFTNKDVFKVLAEAKFGDVFNVSRVKNEKGFWDWTGVTSSNGTVGSNGAPAAKDPNIGGVVASGSYAAPVKTGNVTPKSNYETPEERAARQVLIVRQSSISSAVEFACANKVKDEDEVIRIAKVFERYVFDIKDKVEAAPMNKLDEPPANFFEDLDNDLPI